MLVCLPVCGFVSGNRARLARAADSDVLRPARRIHIRLRGRVLHNSPRRSPAHPSSDRLRGSLRSGDTIPHTCAISPTFRCGAILFVALALAVLSAARLWGSRASPMKEKVRGASAAVTCPGAWRRIGYRTRRTPCSATSATPVTATRDPKMSHGESERSAVSTRAITAVTTGPNETRIATLLSFV